MSNPGERTWQLNCGAPFITVIQSKWPRILSSIEYMYMT